MELVTKRKLAEYFGVTMRTINNWQDRGMPVYKRASRRTWYELEKCIAWHKEAK